MLKWKDELSWQFLQAVGCTNNSNQTRDRWKHPRPGRVAMWEDPFVDTFGAEWKDLLTPELCTINNYKWRREEFVENCATRYGIRRVPKICDVGGIFVKDIDLQEGESPLSLRCEDQLRCSFEIVGDSLLVVNWMNGEFRIYEEKVAIILNAAMEKVHFMVCSGWATFQMGINKF